MFAGRRLTGSRRFRRTLGGSRVTLRVYSLARQLVRTVNALLPRIAERSRDLADQGDRSARSVAANIAEGEHRHDGNGRQRFETAYGSARETRAHLEMAVDVGALREAEAGSAIDLADHVAAGLYKLLRSRSAA